MRATSGEPTQQQTNKEDTDEQQQEGKQNLDDMINYWYGSFSSCLSYFKLDNSLQQDQLILLKRIIQLKK